MVKPQKKIASTSLRQQDPFLEREKLKYANPLPSREFVLQILAEQGVPLYPDELALMLSIKPDEELYFQRRLNAMGRDGEVVLNRKGAVCVAQKLDLIKCKVSGHRDGYGFAIPDEGAGKGSDLFLSEREMKKVMHGDRVMVRAGGVDRRGRAEGKIVEVFERVVTHLVGRVQQVGGVCVVSPEDRRMQHDVLIEPGGESGAKDGQVVMVEILQQPEAHRQPVGRVTEVLGNYADPGMEIEIALRKHALPHVFPDDVLEQAASIPKKVRKKDLGVGRVDLRDLPLVTIDGETARDFDDAVFAEQQGKGYRLVVAIADVSHYVQPSDALDQEALNRGTSVYFPRRVIPMLPEALSNGICSLNPDVDRLCMVCDMRINAKGEVKKYQFYPAVMRSKARLTYNQVWDYLQQGGDHPMLPHLQTLYALFKVLLAARAKRGAIEFDSIETQMLFNDAGKIEKIVPVVRNDAHRLIEECMLAANVCSANFLIKNKHKALFRVHAGPTPEKLENLRTYLRLVGLTLEGGDKPTTKDYAKLAEQIHGRPDAPVVQTMLLRSMQQAVYTPDNEGHFGLAYEAYAHFTSPIRRYPDLLVHRSIKAVLQQSKYKPGKWANLGVHCSMTERRADDASRDVESWLKTYYMRDKIGEVFQGKISAVTGFGVFVLLDEVYAEGLVHISELGKDYFHFKKDIQAIVGEKSGIQYRLGDTVTVRVVSANLESAQVDFALISASHPPIKSVDHSGHQHQPARQAPARKVASHQPIKSGQTNSASVKPSVTKAPVVVRSSVGKTTPAKMSPPVANPVKAVVSLEKAKPVPAKARQPVAATQSKPASVKAPAPAVQAKSVPAKTRQPAAASQSKSAQVQAKAAAKLAPTSNTPQARAKQPAAARATAANTKAAASKPTSTSRAAPASATTPPAAPRGRSRTTSKAVAETPALMSKVGGNPPKTED